MRTRTTPAESTERIAVAERYVDAWNGHDVEAIVSCFVPGGTFSDPGAGELSGPAIGDHAAGLLAAFDDLRFEVASATTTDVDDVLVEWVMRGTNTGPFLDLPPTGETIALPGVSVMTLDGGLIRSVRAYFDQKTFVEQVGLQALITPREIGPISFGVAVHACRDPKTQPGAFSITSISARTDEEVVQIDNASFDIVSQLMETPGFLSWVGVTIGHRGMTITAWEDSETPRHLTRGGPHREAMARFFGSEWAAGGFTSVWSPERINALWVRCRACDTPVDAHTADGACSCGASLPEPPPYF